MNNNHSKPYLIINLCREFCLDISIMVFYYFPSVIENVSFDIAGLEIPVPRMSTAFREF